MLFNLCILSIGILIIHFIVIAWIARFATGRCRRWWYWMRLTTRTIIIPTIRRQLKLNIIRRAHPPLFARVFPTEPLRLFRLILKRLILLIWSWMTFDAKSLILIRCYKALGVLVLNNCVVLVRGAGPGGRSGFMSVDKSFLVVYVVLFLVELHVRFPVVNYFVLLLIHILLFNS